MNKQGSSKQTLTAWYCGIKHDTREQMRENRRNGAGGWCKLNILYEDIYVGWLLEMKKHYPTIRRGFPAIFLPLFRVSLFLLSVVFVSSVAMPPLALPSQRNMDAYIHSSVTWRKEMHKSESFSSTSCFSHKLGIENGGLVFCKHNKSKMA